MMHLKMIQKGGWLLLLTLLALLPGRVWAQAPSGISLNMEVGFDGYYKEGSWIPVTIYAANNGNSVEGELQILVGQNDTELLYATPISLPTQSEKQVTMYIHLPNLASELTLELVDNNGRTLASDTNQTIRQLIRTSLFYVVVSEETVDLDFLENVTGRASNAEVAFIEPAMLPDVPAALDPVNVLILTNLDTGRLSAGQLEAITAWTESGGSLVVTGGVSGAQTTAAVADLLPVTISGTVTVADLPALRQPYDKAFRDPGPYLVTESSLRRGEALLLQDNLPLLARQSLGNGFVYFLALDPNVAPLLDWAGNEALWGEIADGARTNLPMWARGFQNSYSAANAVTRLPNLSLPSWALIACFLGIYILVVGPVNYIVLRRLKRRELAWLTIPALVIFFSGIAYLTGFIFADREITVAQMSVVYGQAGADSGRVHSVIGLYSPRRATYDITLESDVLIRPFERFFGNFTGGDSVGAVVRGSDVLLENVRVDVGGVETFVAQAYQPLPQVSGQVVMQVNGRNAELEITLQNNGDFLLENAGLLIGRTYMPLGDIEPGQVLQRTESFRRASTGALTGSSAGIYSSGSGLSAFYNEIFGTSAYREDPEIYPRMELLEALNDYSPGGLSLPAGAVTLLAWSEQPQLSIELDKGDPEYFSATAYFLELPVTENLVQTAGTEFELPPDLFTWRILSQSGLYSESVSDFYLNGWVEYEFLPWETFQQIDVKGLDVILEASDVIAPGPAPDLRLWDWQLEEWVSVPDPIWGTTTIADAEPFIGPQNGVRLRLEGSGIYIGQVHPVLIGEAE